MPRELLTTCFECGAQIVFHADEDIVTCEYCGMKNARPKSSGDELAAMKRGNELRANCEFEEALKCYEYVLRNFPDEHEALWGKLMCKYGVETVEERRFGKTKRYYLCHRVRKTALRNEGDYKGACKNAPAEICEQYEEAAAYIDGAQAKIREKVFGKPGYDLFICYKETDPVTGGLTEDSGIARDLNNRFTRAGYRVFFAPYTKMAGEDYEAEIYHAIVTSGVMLVVGTKAEYFNATWPSSEWRRYLEVKDDHDGLLIPLYGGKMRAGDLPETFRNAHIQGISMTANPNYAQDIENILFARRRRNGHGSHSGAEQSKRALKSALQMECALDACMRAKANVQAEMSVLSAVKDRLVVGGASGVVDVFGKRVNLIPAYPPKPVRPEPLSLPPKPVLSLPKEPSLPAKPVLPKEPQKRRAPVRPINLPFIPDESGRPRRKSGGKMKFGAVLYILGMLLIVTPLAVTLTEMFRELLHAWGVIDSAVIFTLADCEITDSTVAFALAECVMMIPVIFLVQNRKKKDRAYETALLNWKQGQEQARLLHEKRFSEEMARFSRACEDIEYEYSQACANHRAQCARIEKEHLERCALAKKRYELDCAKAQREYQIACENHNRLCDDLRADYERAYARFEKQNAGYPGECKKLEAELENVLREQRAIVGHRLNELSELSERITARCIQLRERLNALYADGTILPKYRNLLAVGRLYDYMDSGIAVRLEGPDGAYAQFLKDDRKSAVQQNIDLYRSGRADSRTLKNLSMEEQSVIYEELDDCRTVLMEIGEAIHAGNTRAGILAKSPAVLPELVALDRYIERKMA